MYDARISWQLKVQYLVYNNDSCTLKFMYVYLYVYIMRQNVLPGKADCGIEEYSFSQSTLEQVLARLVSTHQSAFCEVSLFLLKNVTI